MDIQRQGQGFALRHAPANTAGTETGPVHPPRQGRPGVHASIEFRRELPPRILRRFQKTNVLVSCGLAIGCLASIAAVAAGCGALYGLCSPLAIALYPLAGAFIARQQRGLELLVHDGSHRAWSRRNPRLNDMLTNVFAAYPSFTDVAGYWRFHKIHHSDYGSPQDPCKRRFEAMRAAFQPGRLARTMLSYVAGWYREAAGKPAAVGRAALWHLCVFVAPLAASVGWSVAATMWLLFWLVPQLVFLPGLRFVAELEEHDYTEGRTEASGTYTNIGWLHAWLVHPLKDGYHLVHHAFPSVPQWKHKALHRILMDLSPRYRASSARTQLLGKRSILGDIEGGSQ